MLSPALAESALRALLGDVAPQRFQHLMRIIRNDYFMLLDSRGICRRENPSSLPLLGGFQPDVTHIRPPANLPAPHAHHDSFMFLDSRADMALMFSLCVWSGTLKALGLNPVCWPPVCTLCASSAMTTAFESMCPMQARL